MFETRWWRERSSQPGGTGGIDDALVRQHDAGIGAEIMGAGKYGFPGWHDDPDWRGWWGPNPPFHTPVFVLTHHTRSEEHTSELQSLMRLSYAVFCLNKKNNQSTRQNNIHQDNK